MPLTVDSVVHGPGSKLPARAMMLALSEELFIHLQEAVISQRSHSTAGGNHPPPPAVELEFNRSQSTTEKVGIRVSLVGGKRSEKIDSSLCNPYLPFALQSPGSLYIGGQALRLTGIPERIFDLYSQQHVPNDTPNTNPLKLHAIVSQSLKVPLSLTVNLAERLHNRTVSEEKERLKRGVVRIDNPVAQPNPKKRKLSPSAQPTPAPSPVPKRVPPRPSQPAVQTLAGPPLSAESLARNAARSNASASDSSSSSSQPLARQAHSHPNGTPQPPISRATSQSSDKVTPPVSSVPHQLIPTPSSSSIPPPISTPNSGTARTASEGWKTSNFRGGVKTKGPPKSATGKATGAGSGSTKAKTVKSNPIITDDLDEPSPPASGHSSRVAAAPRDAPTAKSSSTAVPSAPVAKTGTKRARESLTSVTYDAFTADSDILAAVDVSSSKRGAARAVEAELIAAATATSNGKKAVSATGNSTTTKKGRVPNIDDELLDAAAVLPVPSKTGGSSTAAGKGKSRAPKVNYDDEDWDIREERKQLKKSSGRASTGSASTAVAPPSTPIGANVKVKKVVVSETAARGSPPVRANGNTAAPATATVGKKRPLTQTNAAAATSNGNMNGNTKLSSSQTQTNGSTKSMTINGMSATTAKRSGHVKLSKRTSPIYTDSEEEPQSKHIPNVPKTKSKHLKPSRTASTGAVPPSPVSMTASTSKLTNDAAPRASGVGVAGAVPVKKRPRLDAEDKKTDALIARQLPRSRSALREHYDACYATYMELWARILKEKQRQRRLLREANGTGSDNDEYSSADNVGENVEALTDRYSKLHGRLQTIRKTLGVQSASGLES